MNNKNEIPYSLIIIGLILAMFITLGCNKQDCHYYHLMVYSNEQAAKLKCIGEPNNYPQTKLIKDTLVCLDYIPNEKQYRYTKWCGYLVTETTYYH